MDIIGTIDDLFLIEKFNRLNGEQIKNLFDEMQKEMKGINSVLAVENEKLKKLLKDSFDVNRDLIKEVKKVKKENHVLERKLDDVNRINK